MSPWPGVVAHPLTEPGALSIPPLATAVLAMLAVAAAARFWPARAPRPSRPFPTVFSWEGRLNGAQVAGRVLGAGLLLLGIVAGRLGAPSDLHNVSTALLVGVGWPFLLLGSLIVGPVWRWLDPWDGTLRLLQRGTDDVANDANVWPAVIPAATWAWYLSAFPDALKPANVGLAFGLYTLVTIGGGLIVGRRAWLSRVEVFGLLFGWTSLVLGGASARWRPPPGAEAVLGVLAGGLVFGAVRRSTLWGGLNVVPEALALSTLGVVVLAAVFGVALWALERRARAEGAAGSVSSAAVPAVVGVALALSMHSDLLFTSISLLPELLGDPFGRGWDLFSLRLPLLGLCAEGRFACTALAVVQVSVILGTGLIGAMVLARRVEVHQRRPGMTALCLIVATGVVAVTAT